MQQMTMLKSLKDTFVGFTQMAYSHSSRWWDSPGNCYLKSASLLSQWHCLKPLYIHNKWGKMCLTMKGRACSSWNTCSLLFSFKDTHHIHSKWLSLLKTLDRKCGGGSEERRNKKVGERVDEWQLSQEENTIYFFKKNY